MQFSSITPAKIRPAGLRRAPQRAVRAMTIVEVTIALVVFTLASASFTAAYGLLNSWATRLRCDAAANAILRAKVAKVLTDPWIPQSTPVDSVVTTGEQLTTADPADSYDIGPTVTLLSSSDAPGTAFITATVYRNTRAFEAAAKTVVIDYRLTYTYRGKSYSSYASTIRAADK